jgi:hypothetical protein
MGVIFGARQRHFRRICVVKRVLVITGIPTKTLARLPLPNANGPQAWIIRTVLP